MLGIMTYSLPDRSIQTTTISPRYIYWECLCQYSRPMIKLGLHLTLPDPTLTNVIKPYHLHNISVGSTKKEKKKKDTNVGRWTDTASFFPSTPATANLLSPISQTPQLTVDEHGSALPSENAKMHNSMHTTIRDHWRKFAPSYLTFAPCDPTFVPSYLTFAPSDPTFAPSDQRLRAPIDDPRCAAPSDVLCYPTIRCSNLTSMIRRHSPPDPTVAHTSAFFRTLHSIPVP